MSHNKRAKFAWTRKNRGQSERPLLLAWGKASNLTFHPEYKKLGTSTESRCHEYRELFRYQLSEQDVHLIENASEYCHPVCDDRFVQQIEGKFGIRLRRAARGRPRKLSVTG